MNEKKINNLLEFILYFLLGTLTGYVGLTAALFIAYIANYKKYWSMIAGFLIGWVIYVISIGPNLTHTGVLVYFFVVIVIAGGIAYMLHEDKNLEDKKNG
jgi:high-affinity Fe2+/Pb2+ permease